MPEQLQLEEHFEEHYEEHLVPRPEAEQALEAERQHDPLHVAQMHEYLTTERAYIKGFIGKMLSRGMVGWEQDHEDIEQDIIRRLLEHPDYVKRRDDGVLICKPLASIVSGYIIDHYRRQAGPRGKMKLMDHRDPTIEVKVLAVEPPNHDYYLGVAAVREALETLPPKSRELIDLFYFQDLPQEEIVRRTDYPSVGAVKARLVRIRRLLAEHFQQQGVTSYTDILDT